MARKYIDAADDWIDDQVTQGYDWVLRTLEINEDKPLGFSQVDLSDLASYINNTNRFNTCYFADGTPYGYVTTVSAFINADADSSLSGHVNSYPVALEVLQIEDKYSVAGIDVNSFDAIGHFAWGNASPSIAAAGVVNALGMYIDGAMYGEAASYWWDLISDNPDLAKCRSFKNNTIPVCVDLNSNKTYVPWEFINVFTKSLLDKNPDLANSLDGYTGSKVIDDNTYEYYGFSQTPWFNAAHGELAGSYDSYSTSAGTIIMYNNGFITPMVVSKTPLENVTVTAKYKHRDGTITTETKTGNVTNHVTLSGVDYYYGEIRESWWQDYANDERFPLFVTFYNASVYDRERMIEAVLTGIIHYDGLPDFFTYIDGSVKPNWHELQDGNILGLQDAWRSNSISITALDRRSGSDAFRTSVWFPIAIPYNFDSVPVVTNDPEDYYNSVDKPIPDDEQHLDGGTTNNYINNNIVGPTINNYYTYNFNGNNTDPTPVPWEKDKMITDIGDTLDYTESLDDGGGIGNVYVPTKAQMQKLSYWLFNTDLDAEEIWNKIKQYFTHPMDAIVGIHQLYFRPKTKGMPEPIQLGFITARDLNAPGNPAIEASVVDTRNRTQVLGYIKIDEYFGNVFDYSPYTSFKLFLPFLGIVSIPVEPFMRGTMIVSVTGDCMTGALNYSIKSQRDGTTMQIATYGANCAVQYPLSSTTYNNLISGAIGVTAGVATAIVTKNPAGIIGGVTGAVGSAASMADRGMQTSGGYGASTGALGLKKPYLIIERNIPNMPNDYPHYTGNPYNKTGKLYAYKGFTKCGEVHLDASGISSREKDMIIAELQKGVIL